jgi:hypothetical protein
MLKCVLRKYCLLVLSLRFAVSWLRRLVPGLSRRRPGLAPHSVHVRFLIGKAKLGAGFSLQLFSFPLSVLFYRGSISGGWTIGPLVAAVHRHSLTQLTWTKCTSLSMRNWLRRHVVCDERYELSSSVILGRFLLGRIFCVNKSIRLCHFVEEVGSTFTAIQNVMSCVNADEGCKRDAPPWLCLTICQLWDKRILWPFNTLSLQSLPSGLCMNDVDSRLPTGRTLT